MKASSLLKNWFALTCALALMSCNLPTSPASSVVRTPVKVPSAMTPTSLTTTTLYQDPDGLYMIEYPKTWSVQKAGSQQQFCSDTQTNTCVAISIHIKAASLKTFTDEESKSMGQLLEGYQENNRQSMELSGFPASYLEQTYRYKGTTLRGFTLLAVRNRIGFKLMVWTPEAAYNQVFRDLRDLVQGFQILEFDDVPPYDSWLTSRTDHLTFRYLKDTWLQKQIEKIAVDHELAYRSIVQTLNVNFNGPITFYMYTTPEAFYLATARDAGFAIDTASEVHARWFSPTDKQTLGHEMTHVIAYGALGRPSEALMGEGLAVCLDQEPRDVKAVGRDLVNKGKWLPLNEMLGSQWGVRDTTAAYQQSGVVVCGMFQLFGATKVKQIYTEENFTTGLQKLTGQDLASLEALLKDWMTK